MLRRPASWLLACVAVPALLAVTSVNYWHGFPSPNERARAYQAIAVANRGSLTIGTEVERFGAMEDISTHDGATYPNKAPGLLPLLLPAAAVATLVPDRIELETTLVLGRLVASSLPMLLTIVLLAALVNERWPRGGPPVVVMWALASPALPASLLLFAHSLTALLVLVAYVLLFEGRLRGRAGLAAGFALAWAFACEYQLAVPAAVLVLLALPRWRARIVAVALGAALPLALLGAYNRACFGSALTLSSAHEASPAFADLASQGLFGISFPNLSGLAGLLASPSRGLLIFAPLAFLCIVGRRGRDDGDRAANRAALLLAPLALLLLMSGYPNWHGGMFPGPRYLLGVLPLLALAAAGGAERLLTSRPGTACVGFLFAWGALMVWPITATFPFPPPEEPFPSLVLAPTLAAWGARFPSWLPSGASTVIWSLAAIAAAAVLLSTVANRRAAAAGALLAVATAALATTAPAPREWRARVARAVIHDVFIGAPPGALEELRQSCSRPAECAQVDSWILRREALRTTR